MCIAAVAVTAQEKADIVVGYDYSRIDTRGNRQTNKMTLLASSSESKYFNDLSLWTDSLKSTPEGKAKLQEIIMKACMVTSPDGAVSFDMRKGPCKTIYTYVFTRPADGQLTIYDKWGGDLCYYAESLSELSWHIDGDSAATVLGYECVMAEADYHGRHWKAWFAPEVPLPYGPWKLQGLPGLILRAEADGGFLFEATGIESTDRVITPMYLANEYSKTDRKKALENNEYVVNNTESVMRAQYGATVTVRYQDDNGNEIAAPVFDGLIHSLEPDYKKAK